MKFSRLFGALIALTTCLCVQASASEYQATAQMRYASKRPLASIAMAPFSCPFKRECADFSMQLADLMYQRTDANIIDADAVADLMDQASIADLSQLENRLIVGEGLGVDAFAFVTIDNAQVEVVTPSGADNWKAVKRDVSVKRAKLTLKVIARDGSSLAQVSGEAELPDTLKTLPEITGRLFEVMLEQAWPRSK